MSTDKQDLAVLTQRIERIEKALIDLLNLVVKSSNMLVTPVGTLEKSPRIKIRKIISALEASTQK